MNNELQKPQKLNKNLISHFAIILSLNLISLFINFPELVIANNVRECGRPFVFKDKPVNVVIVQYSFDRGDEFDEEFRQTIIQTAIRLTWLIKLDTVFNAAHGGLGIVSHISDSDPELCDPEIIESLLIPYSVSPRQNLIFVSGRIYQKDKYIFLQTKIKRVRLSKDKKSKPIWDRVRFAINDPKGDTIFLDTNLPGKVVTFPPRQMQLSDLVEIEQMFYSSSKLHTEPDSNSEYKEIKLNPIVNNAFGVTHIRSDGWIRIIGAMEGWVRLDPKAAKYTRQFLPELDFLAGLVSFQLLEQSFVEGKFGIKPASMLEPISQAFDRYVTLDKAIAGEQPKAVALSLTGIAYLYDGREKSVEAALDKFKTACSVQPYNADLINLKAIAIAYLSSYYGKRKEMPGKLIESLHDALAVKPNSIITINNLDSLYGYLEANPAMLSDLPQGLSVTELRERRVRLSKMKRLLNE